MLKESGQAGEDRYFELLVTPQMRRAGADAIDDLFEAGSLEEKAEAAYRAMVAASNFPIDQAQTGPRHQDKNLVK